MNVSTAATTTAIPPTSCTTPTTTPPSCRRASPHRVVGSVVRFQPNETLSDVKLIPSVRDYEQCDVMAIWGEDSTQVEDTKRKQVVKHELRQFLLGRQASDNKNFTTIGLRDKYGPRQQDKIKIRDIAWDAVLFEQYLQRHNKEVERFVDNKRQSLITDPTNEEQNKNQSMIAAVYRNVSKQAQHVAQEEAKELEQELTYIRMEENEESSREQVEFEHASSHPSSSPSLPRGRSQRKETSTRRPTFDVQAWINGRKKIANVNC